MHYRMSGNNDRDIKRMFAVIHTSAFKVVLVHGLGSGLVQAPHQRKMTFVG
jgi:hypothetical protein